MFAQLFDFVRLDQFVSTNPGAVSCESILHQLTFVFHLVLQYVDPRDDTFSKKKC